MEFAVAHQITLTTIECCNCGVPFAFPDRLMAKLKENGEWFFCPNGHRQHFTRTEVDRLRKMLEEANRNATQLAADRMAAEKTADAMKRENRRLMKRISGGVCPCCNRTFTDLARHMATKHHEQTKELK